MDVLLGVVVRLAGRPGPRPHAAVNGAGLEYQPPRFREHLRGLFAAAGDLATDAGPYRPDELPARMAGAD